MNKKISFLILLILSCVVLSNAQKLVSDGKPKLFKTPNGVKAYEIKFPGGVFVRKSDRENDDQQNGKFSVGKNARELGTFEGSIVGASSADKFFAFYGDLDKNKSAELIVVDFEGQSNGLGINYYSVSIFPDFETKGYQTPATFSTEEFGEKGTFIYDAKINETLILVTDFNGLDNISKKPGTYFVGRYFRYQNGLLKPAADKPILARRYTNAFERERLRTEENPLRPFLWLSSPTAQKLKNDPEFSLKPVSSQTGVIEKYEEIKSDVEDQNGEVVDIVETKQIIVKFDSGETKTIILSENSNNPSQSDNRKIHPEIFGVAPGNISLPKGVSPTTVFGKLEGRKITLNSYPPFELDEAKNPRFKVLFEN